MNLDQYIEITGQSFDDDQLIGAQIIRTQRILETMLGYTLDTDLADDNQYEEIGKSSVDCPCPEIDMETLEDPDDVVGSYRMYTYNKHDKYLAIDPASAVHAVKLVKDGITFRTLDTDDYRLHYKQGIVKYLERCERWCFCVGNCSCTQLAVDADYLWDTDSEVPNDLMQVWADMVTYYADAKFDIKSETLGTHSYTRNVKVIPETLDHNLAVIKKYAGPNGSMYRTITV